MRGNNMVVVPAYDPEQFLLFGRSQLLLELK